MTLRHLMIFQAVCESECNSTRAAEKLHMTQPAISLAIKELEEYYGVKLFDRIGRRLSLTQAGERFLQYAIHINDLFKDMETGLRNWEYKGVLRVGSSITIGSYFLPEYVKAFSMQMPETEVRVKVEQTEYLEQQILNNELDIALIEGIVHSSNIISSPYLEDRLTIVCSVKSPWKQGQIISIEEFVKQPFLLREAGSGTREVFDNAIQQAGYSIDPLWEATSSTALINATINGLGIAVLPQRMVLSALRNGLIKTIRVKGLDFKRSFKVIYHKDKFLTPSASAFIDLVRNYELDYPSPMIVENI